MTVIRRGKGRYRPNVLPAKSNTIGNRVEEIIKHNTQTKAGTRRKTIGDICDFCFRNIKVKRVALHLRHKKGWRFSCQDCCVKNKFDLKTDKIWLDEYSRYKLVNPI